MTTTPNSAIRSTDGSNLDQPTIFDVLSSKRRRFLLWYLLGETEPTTLDELAYRIARWEDGPTTDESERVRVDLYHRHLPKLTEAGLVRYDEATSEVQYEPVADRLVPYLELASNEFVSVSESDAR